MSQETLNWLNRYALVGLTSQRKSMVDPVDPCESRFDAQGRSWHFRAELQGIEPNHYEGPVPIEDVRRRLFHWKPIEVCPVRTSYVSITEHGVEEIAIEDPTAKQILRPRGSLGADDKGAILGQFRKGYKIHDYDEWLLKTPADILETAAGELVIGSALLLAGGGVACVSIETPEYITGPGGVEFKPRILCGTSVNGSLSSTYQGVTGIAVCDNTMRAAFAEGGSRLKVKHSKGSIGKLTDVRDALGIAHSMEAGFAADLEKWLSAKLPEPKWEAFKDGVAPVAKNGEALTGRALINATNKRDALDKLWNDDERVAPWKGTAYGAVAAVNTYEHWIKGVRDTGAKGVAEDDRRPEIDVRMERNSLRALKGEFETVDCDALNLALALA